MKNDAKKEYWNTLYDLNYADISKVDKNDTNNYGDDIPEDVFSSSKGYIKGSQTLSSDKIQILNQISTHKTLKAIEQHLKAIKTYISIAFWLSLSAGIIYILALLINLTK